MIPSDKSLGYFRCVPAGLTPADSCRAASDVATARFIRVIRTIRGFFAWCRRNKVLVANHIRKMGAAFGALRAIFRALFGRLCIAGDYASLRARKWAKKWP